MPTLIDPRGPRFAATLTSVVLALVLLTAPGTLATVLLAAQTAVFAVGAVAGVQHTPYSLLFRTRIRPRLGPAGDLEDSGPPRFAQAVGLGFALVGLLGLLTGLTTLGLVAVGFALAAALLNAVTGFCLGCEVYLLVKRISFPTTSPPPAVEVRGAPAPSLETPEPSMSTKARST